MGLLKKNGDTISRARIVNKTGRRTRGPHPYWGFASDLFGQTISIQNPIATTTDEIKFAILGGSVAASICEYIVDQTIDAPPKIIRNYFKQYQKITITCYAEGGYRQPQALNIINILQPDLDFTINIEGNNELEYELPPGIPHYFPLSSFTHAFYSTIQNSNNYFQSINTMNKIDKLKQRLSSHNYKIKTFELFDQVRLLALRKELAKFIHKNKLSQKKLSEGLTSVSMRTRLKFWLNMSCQQNNTLALRDINSYYFMQPLPYLTDSKQLTKNEERLISHYKKNKSSEKKFNEIEENYNHIDQMQLKNLGIKMYNLKDIFKTNTETVFSDGCCHLNRVGRKIMLENILNRINPTEDKVQLCNLVKQKK